MLSKTNIYKAKRFCCEDISLIENYDKAMNDDSETIWICHHRKGIELNKSQEELEEMGLYYNRPACELMFVTISEHQSLHKTGKIPSQKTREKISNTLKGHKSSQETREKLSIALKGIHKSDEHRRNISKATKGISKPKYRWLTPDGQTKIMNKRNAKYYHPDWTLIGPA